MSDIVKNSWDVPVSYVNAVDYSKDRRLKQYHPRANIKNDETAYRQSTEIGSDNKFKIKVGRGHLGGKDWSDMAKELFALAEFELSYRFPDTYECKAVKLADLSASTPSQYTSVIVWVTLVSANAPDPLNPGKTYSLFLTTLLWNSSEVAKVESAAYGGGTKTSYTWRD